MTRTAPIVALLLSHHPPVQHNRTLCLRPTRNLRSRLCARCTGEAAGLVVTLCFLRHLAAWPGWVVFIVATILTLPAIVDWSTQAMEWRESTNWLRLITGAMFASGCVMIGRFLFLGYFALFAASLGSVAVLGLTALKLLQRAGAIDRVLLPFEAYAESLLDRTPG
jgi:uncharacterized membrane protein